MKKTSASIGTIFLILVLTACSLPGGTDPTPEGAETAPGTATPTEVPAPLPTGYTELLQAKIASGEWTMETGLVTMLQLFVGEIPTSQAGLAEGVLDSEGTGVLQMAGDYLLTGSDQATKDEITRLVDLLVPTQEALDRFSVPMAQAAVRSPGQAAPRLPEEEVKCNTLWESGFPDTLTPRVPCFLFKGGSVGLDEYSVYTPAEWQGDDSREEIYRASVDAVVAAITEYQQYGAVKPITLVFSTREQAGGLDSLVLAYYKAFRPASEACPIVIFPGALTALTSEQLQQKIAHEIFHCFQARNLPRQMLGPMSSSLWWVEGTAEYFSNLVYPHVNLEHLYKASFAIYSTVLPLTAMAHENFAFFQFMGNEIGPVGVMAMLEMMPIRPGSDEQTAALAAVPGMEDYFEEFVRSVIDGTLEDSDGNLIPFLFFFTAQSTFTEVTSRGFSSQRPFVLSRYWVSFAGEREYILSGAAVSPGGEGRSGVRLIVGTAEDWAIVLPLELGGCDPLHYIYYVVTTTPESEYEETITTSEVTEQPCDRCLIGSWEATNESMEAYMRSAGVADSATIPEIQSVIGAMFLQFDEYGNGTSGYSNLRVHETGGGDIEGVDVFVTMDGTSSGRYHADGAELTAFPELTNITVSVEIMLNLESLGISTDALDPEDLPLRPAVPTRYTCEGNTLTTWPPAEGGTIEPMVWLRATP